MPVADTKIIELVNIIYDYLCDLDEISLSPFLSEWPSKPFKIRIAAQSKLPVLSYLPELIVDANAETERLVKTFKILAEHLAWGQTYSTDDFGVDFLKKYGWTELIGLRGPVDSKDIACGFLMLGPDIEYPMHSHGAEEVYVPMNSQTLWMQGDDPWVLRPGGVPIYHSSWLQHGMRTESAPLLALYLWRGGDLTQKSR
ncbi:MAG: dimethylsulfoniopropionate lyase, partial [Desulfobacteraceae bacterium]|nr:dimethylsulfoniopropionate lyase [Desulfobacteraceae bacterium]